MFNQSRQCAAGSGVERRRHARVDVRLIGVLHDPSETPAIPCIIQNISLGGVKVLPDCALPKARLSSPTLILSIPQFAFTMPVRLMWGKPMCCGFAFDYDRPDELDVSHNDRPGLKRTVPGPHTNHTDRPRRVEAVRRSWTILEANRHVRRAQISAA